MNLRQPQLPSGNGCAQHSILKPALSDDLFEQMLTSSNLRRAWKRVKANKGKPGVDGVSIEDFPEYLKIHWERIQQQLREGTYQPAPVRRIRIPKPDGGERLLGIPTVMDRLIQQSILQVLTPVFDPDFSEYSYGFRPQRRAGQAVKRLHTGIKSGHKIAVDVDLSKFFDRVNHDLLMNRLGRKVQNKEIKRLIGKYLRAGISENGWCTRTTEGVPQGGPLSPLLSNILLDELDKTLEIRGHHFARYADDFTILVKSRRAGERVLGSITRFVQRKLKLKVNEKKSRVGPVSETKFLGFGFKYGYIRIHERSLEKFKQEVRRLTNRNWGISMTKQIQILNRYLRGWGNYFLIANAYQLSVDLDHWIRRRIRMCYWRQWRKPRTKVRSLIKLGVPVKMAIDCGITSKGPWRSSRTYGINMGLNDKFLRAQGLLNLRGIWISLHHGDS